MSNPYYTVTGTPATSSAGASAPMRSEFTSIQAAFAKFPDFTALPAGSLLVVNYTNNGIVTAPGVVVTSTGLFGIGQSSPGFQLDILNTQNAVTTANILNASAGAAAAATYRLSNGTHITAMAITGTGYTAGVTYDLQDSCYFVTDGAGGLNLATVNAAAKISFYTGSPTPPARMTILPSGNVGIGTTNPADILDISLNQNGNSIVGILNASSGSAAKAQFLAQNGTNSLAVTMNGASFTTSGVQRLDGAVVQTGGAGGLTLNTLVSQPIYFCTNSTERVRIDANGNVGIGMTPVNFLDLTKSQSSTSKINLLNANTAGAAAMAVGADTATLYYAAAGSTQGGTTYAGLSGNNQTIFEAESASSFYIGTTPACPIVFAQNRVEVARIDNSGNVLIGATTRTVSEKVNITQSTAGVVGLFVNCNNGTPGAENVVQVSFSGAAPNNTSAVFFIGTDSATTRFVVYSNGNVVNTNNSYGAISARAVKQDIRPAPDHWDTVKTLSENAVNYRLKVDVKEKGANASVLLGGVAEDWENIDPDLVFTDGQSGHKCINYAGAYMRGLIALGAALKRIEQLEARVVH